MNEELKIETILKSKGYSVIREARPKELSWGPDLLLKKDKELLAILIRKSDDISEVFVQRIAKTKNAENKIHSLIIFCKKPKLTSIKTAVLYGVGVYYLHGNQIEEISKPSHFIAAKPGPLKKKIVKEPKMPRTDIFISSHQVIEERGTSKKIIDELKDTYRFPIFAILVEEDSRYGIDKTKKCIDRNLQDSELFVCILAEKHRAWVEYEVKKAFKCEFKSEDIFVFVKNLKTRHQAIKRLIDWIKSQNTVKYQPYTDKREFETKLRRALMLRIKKIHKKLNIAFMA